MIGYSQMVTAGLTRQAVASRVESGHLIRVHRGVYLVGHAVAPEYAREQAALLAVGEHAVLSHLSAARVWGLLQHATPVHVSVTRGQPRPREGIAVHRPAHLGPDQIRSKNRLPLTSPARTLADLRPHVSAALHGAATNEPHGITRSEAERKLRRLIRQAGLPRPENDGYATHGHRIAFERDRAKQQALAAAGLRVSRVTWRQLDDPYRVVAGLAQALAFVQPAGTAGSLADARAS